MLSHDKKEEIKSIIKGWIKDKVNKLLKLEPQEIHPNPFLLRSLGITEGTKEAFEFGIRQRIERSLVTSFGQSVFPNILKILGFEDAGIEDIDHVFIKEGIKYYIQLKSGPEGFTRPALRKTKQTFDRLKKEIKNCKTVIAFAYGKKEYLSKIWGDEAKKSTDKVLIGKEFWDFFFGESTYTELLNLFEDVGKDVVREMGKEGSLYEELVNRLLDKIKGML